MNRPGRDTAIVLPLTLLLLAAFHSRKLERVVEPGEIKLMIGASSEDIRLAASFQVE